MMTWRGFDDIRPDTDDDLARVVRDEILPSAFTDRLKHMTVTEDDRLETTGLGDGPSVGEEDEADE